MKSIRNNKYGEKVSDLEQNGDKENLKSLEMAKKRDWFDGRTYDFK